VEVVPVAALLAVFCVDPNNPPLGAVLDVAGFAAVDEPKSPPAEAVVVVGGACEVVDAPNNPPLGAALEVGCAELNRPPDAGALVVCDSGGLDAPKRPPLGAALVVAGAAEPKRPPVLDEVEAGCAEAVDWKRPPPVVAPDVAVADVPDAALDAALFRPEKRPPPEVDVAVAPPELPEVLAGALFAPMF
jgi:hypothetical protein